MKTLQKSLQNFEGCMASGLQIFRARDKIKWKNVCGRNGGKETMKIALINENSQAAKNAMIEGVLRKVVEPMGHEVLNYGM